MMRFVAFLLATYIFVLAVQPCADSFGATDGGGHSIETSSHIDPPDTEESGDECSPFCICNCCGGTAASKISPVAIQLPKTSLSKQVSISGYEVRYVSNDLYSIWQPPRA